MYKPVSFNGVEFAFSILRRGYETVGIRPRGDYDEVTIEIVAMDGPDIGGQTRLVSFNWVAASGSGEWNQPLINIPLNVNHRTERFVRLISDVLLFLGKHYGFALPGELGEPLLNNLIAARSSGFLYPQISNLSPVVLVWFAFPELNWNRVIWDKRFGRHVKITEFLSAEYDTYWDDNRSYLGNVWRDHVDQVVARSAQEAADLIEADFEARLDRKSGWKSWVYTSPRLAAWRKAGRPVESRRSVYERSYEFRQAVQQGRAYYHLNPIDANELVRGVPDVSREVGTLQCPVSVDDEESFAYMQQLSRELAQ